MSDNPNDRSHTVIRPRPGGRPSPGAPSAPAQPSGQPAGSSTQVFGAIQTPVQNQQPQQPAPASAPPPASPPPQPQRGTSDICLGMNPLTDAAGKILSLVTQLRNAPSHSDVRSLHRQTIELIREFEQRIQAAGLDSDTLFSARYTLCALIDETILNTPWGSNSFWSTESLLTTFHRETWGGEHVYRILDATLQAPAQHIHLLELLYICLSLGFMGKLRVTDRGDVEHERLRERVYATLREISAEPPKELSAQWQTSANKFNRLTSLIPIWVVIAIFGLILVGVYLGFSYLLNQDSTPVAREVAALVPWDNPAKRDEPTSVAVKSEADRLREFLQPEIEKKLVEVNEYPGQITIKLAHSGLFASGTDRISDQFKHVLRRIGDALLTTNGDILVVGHTDNIPIFTARFPSNWHLSEARAKSVVKQLSGSSELISRMRAEGRGDTEPLVPNDTKENRAKNRRVEIILFEQPRGGLQ